MKALSYLGPSSFGIDTLEIETGLDYLNSSYDSESAVSVSSADYSVPPDLQLSDYIEICLLISMVVVGGPLNLVSLFRSLKTNFRDFFRCCFWTMTSPLISSSGDRRPRSETSLCKRPLTLRFHLTVANLLVLWVYGLSEICWRCTYSWRGGDLLCRSIRFVHAFCFYATSNLVAAIGLDRLYVTVNVDRPRSRLKQSGRFSVRHLARVAWSIAFLSSVPQLFIWQTFEPFPDNASWRQCVTTWVMQKYKHLQENNETDVTNAAQVELYFQEKLYDGLHLALVFWIPAIFITVSYASIVTRFNWNIRKTSRQQERPSIVDRPLVARRATVAAFSGNVGNLLRVPSSNQKAKFRFASFEFNRIRRKSLINDKNNLELSDSPIRNKVGVDAEEPSSTYSTTIAHVECQKNDRGRGRAAPRCSFAVVTLTRAKQRTVKKTVWILLAYFIFWSPYNVLALWRYFYPTFEHSYLEIMYNLIVLNAVVNPIIYGI